MTAVYQQDIFAELYPKFVIDKPIRLIEMFAGIGSQSTALERLGVEYEAWKVVEFDKYCIKSYNAIHHTQFETSDIRDVHAADLEIVERDKYCYILTYSFPCQDLSIAGHQKGMKKGEGTRSGLLWEVERILDECGSELPHVLLMENVPMVIAEKNIEDFYSWRNKLETLGYSSYAQILNAKDYGIPQSRARCFMVSILGQYNYEFPKKVELKLRLKDMLDDEVDEKYYLSDRGGEFVLKPFRLRKKYTQINGEIALALTANGQSNWTGTFIADGKWQVKRLFNIYGYTGGNFAGNVYDIDALAPTLINFSGGGNRQPLIQQWNDDMKIRKLTPKECWRLMGFTDEDFERAKAVNSDTQLYKQAGNSIVVQVLEAIFREMLPEERKEE